MKNKCQRNADHLRICEIRTRLDMTQSEFADAMSLITGTLASYERGRTMKVPVDVMQRAEEILMREEDTLDWRLQFDGLSMADIVT